MSQYIKKIDQLEGYLTFFSALCAVFLQGKSVSLVSSALWQDNYTNKSVSPVKTSYPVTCNDHILAVCAIGRYLVICV